MECGDFDLRTLVTILVVFWAIAAQLARALKRLNRGGEQPQPAAQAEDYAEEEHDDDEALDPATLTPAERRALAERLGLSPEAIDRAIGLLVGSAPESAAEPAVEERVTLAPPVDELVAERELPEAWRAGSLEIEGWLEGDAGAHLGAAVGSAARSDQTIALDLSPAAWRDALVLHELWHRPHRR